MITIIYNNGKPKDNFNAISIRLYNSTIVQTNSFTKLDIIFFIMIIFILLLIIILFNFKVV